MPGACLMPAVYPQFAWVYFNRRHLAKLGNVWGGRLRKAPAEGQGGFGLRLGSGGRISVHYALLTLTQPWIM